ncbi:MAG: hypothetical protein AABY06_02725, partial [Nanoarchaeota archaeon]
MPQKRRRTKQKLKTQKNKMTNKIKIPFIWSEYKNFSGADINIFSKEVNGDSKGFDVTGIVKVVEGDSKGFDVTGIYKEVNGDSKGFDVTGFGKVV